MRTASVPVSACLLALLVACGTVEERSSTTVHRDSAGVTIVENSGPSWQPGEEWRVDSMPLFAIAPDAGENAEFQRINGVVRLDDGTVIALDQREPFVRAFSSKGEIAWTAVREGDGPGEIRNAVVLQRIRGDSLSVEGDFSPRSILLTGDGSHAGEVPTIEIEAGAPDVIIRRQQILMRLADGSGVGLISEIRRADLGGTSEPSPLLEYHLVQRDGTSKLLGRWPMMRFGQLLGPIFAWAPLADGFIYGWPTTDEFRIHDDSGAVRMLVRGPAKPRVPMTDEIAHARKVAIAMFGDDPQSRRSVEEMSVADSISLYRRLVSARTGEIWRERFDPETDGRFTFPPDGVTWDVFAADGTLLGPVQMPPRFTLLDAGADWLAGIHIDEMDVQTPRAYSLVRP